MTAATFSTLRALLMHWDQAKALFGAGSSRADSKLRMKKKRLPVPYLIGITAIMTLGIGLPYGNELWRCMKARNEPHYDGRQLT